MDAYGIRPALEAHAQRLASHGYCVFLPNVFYRGGRSPVVENLEEAMRAEDRAPLWAELMPRIKTLTPEAAIADSQAWLAFLRARPEVREAPIGTVGYCMGGRLSLRMAGEFADAVAAAASFHGGGLATGEDSSPHLAAVRAAGELYIGHADNDGSMDPGQMGRLTTALADAHVRHTAELYVGAQHGWTQTDTPPTTSRRPSGTGYACSSCSTAFCRRSVSRYSTADAASNRTRARFAAASSPLRSYTAMA